MKTLTKATALALATLALAACSSAPRNACAKAKECCGVMSQCEAINKSGAGWEDRCEIDLTGEVSKFGTYHLAACDLIADALLSYIECVGGVSCTDVSNDAHAGHVARCDTQAKGYCNALRSSGDACGFDFGNKNCDNYQASLSIYAVFF